MDRRDSTRAGGSGIRIPVAPRFYFLKPSISSSTRYSGWRVRNSNPSSAKSFLLNRPCRPVHGTVAGGSGIRIPVAPRFLFSNRPYCPVHGTVAGVSGIRIPVAPRIFFSFLKPSILSVDPTQLPIKWVPGFIAGIQQQGVNLASHFHLATTLRMSGAVPLLPPICIHGVGKEKHRDFRFPPRCK